MSDNTALDVLIQSIGAINMRLAETQQRADDHFGLDPDRVNWSHAETAQSIAAELHRIRLMVNQLSGR